jgi:hypothetical protein
MTKINATSTKTMLHTSLAKPVDALGNQAARLPWNGGLSKEELVRPGAHLISALIYAANERRQSMTKMSKELDVTYSYINQIRNGYRRTTDISDKFALCCARYLGIPRLTILMMAGKITTADVFESDEMKTTQITQAMLLISQDAIWAPLVTFELRQACLESQYCVVRLFEKATGRVLMDKHLDLVSMTAEIDRLSSLRLNILTRAQEMANSKDEPVRYSLKI